MMISATHLLLIESNPADARLIKKALRNDGTAFIVEWVTSLAEAVNYLIKNQLMLFCWICYCPMAKAWMHLTK